MAYDENTAQRVRDVLAGKRAVEKKLMGGLCFMVGGAMCCAVSGRGGLLVRIDPAARLGDVPYAAGGMAASRSGSIR